MNILKSNINVCIFYAYLHYNSILMPMNLEKEVEDLIEEYKEVVKQYKENLKKSNLLLEQFVRRFK